MPIFDSFFTHKYLNYATVVIKMVFQKKKKEGVLESIFPDVLS